MKYLGKKSFIFVLLLCSTVTVHAQFDGTTWEQRIGTGKDSIEAHKLYIGIYNDFINPKRKNPKREYNDSTYMMWRKILAYAPYVDYQFYISGWMEDLLIPLIRRQNDRAIQLMYFQDLMEIQDRLIWDRKKLNSLRMLTNLKNEQSEEDALVNKAHYYYSVGKQYFSGTPAYNPDSAYWYYSKAFEKVRESKDVTGSEIIGIYLWEYFDTSYSLFKDDQEKYQEQFLTDYLDCISSCDKMLMPAYDETDSIKQQQILAKYWHYRDTIQKVFNDSSGAATPQRLDDYYGKRLDKYRKDAAYLNKAIHLMTENNATGIDAYYAYCEASYVLNPTYENSIGCALSSKRDGMQEEMIKYFLQAKGLAGNDLQKALVAYMIGVASNITRPKDPETNKNYPIGTPEYKQWQKSAMLAEANLKQVLDLEPALMNSGSIDIREIPAHAAWQIALAEYRMSQSSRDCDEAIKYVRLAMQKQPNLYNRNAQDMITNISNARKQHVDNENNRKRNNRQLNAQRNAEYEEYLRRKKAEEDFWNKRR